jgi:ABC-type sugar transport system permease subunit
LLPSTAYLVLFFAWPMAKAFGLAFQTDEGQLTLAYLQRMFGDAAFSEALLSTFPGAGHGSPDDGTVAGF